MRWNNKYNSYEQLMIDFSKTVYVDSEYIYGHIKNNDVIAVDGGKDLVEGINRWVPKQYRDQMYKFVYDISQNVDPITHHTWAHAYPSQKSMRYKEVTLEIKTYGIGTIEITSPLSILRGGPLNGYWWSTSLDTAFYYARMHKNPIVWQASIIGRGIRISSVSAVNSLGFLIDRYGVDHVINMYRASGYKVERMTPEEYEQQFSVCDNSNNRQDFDIIFLQEHLMDIPTEEVFNFDCWLEADKWVADIFKDQYDFIVWEQEKGSFDIMLLSRDKIGNVRRVDLQSIEYDL
jgi:hypothetical protein